MEVGVEWRKKALKKRRVSSDPTLGFPSAFAVLTGVLTSVDPDDRQLLLNSSLTRLDSVYICLPSIW
jgi:hypothetical protein